MVGTTMRPELIPHELKDSNFEHSLPVLCKRYLQTYTNLQAENSMLDVGGRADGGANHYAQELSYWVMDYKILNVVGEEHPRFIKGDITNCPQIPDNSIDFVYSSDTFEHISKPWLAAKEITRILKPGGFCFISTLFAWRYHKEPEDYFRYTPFGLISLFEDGMEALESNWDGKNRRGPTGGGMQGDGTANDIVPVDLLGAWRENWRVYYFGKKKK